MAKKKRKSHGPKRRRRSHRMGAVNLQLLGMKIMGIGAAAFLDSVGRKNLPTLNQKVVGMVEIAIGALGPQLIKTNSPLIEGVGQGFIAVGTLNVLKGFSVISGIGAAAVPARVPLRRPMMTPGQLAVSGTPRAFLNQNVGNMMDPMAAEMMGALYYED